jgi:cytochrome c
MAKALSGSGSRIIALGLIAMLFAASANAQETTRQRQGQRIVANKCSGCHAVGPFGESRNPKAPAFRTLHERYPIESLAEALAEGTISAASDEPEFNFSGREVGAIISYNQHDTGALIRERRRLSLSACLVANCLSVQTERISRKIDVETSRNGSVQRALRS